MNCSLKSRCPYICFSSSVNVVRSILLALNPSLDLSSGHRHMLCRICREWERTDSCVGHTSIPGFMWIFVTVSSSSASTLADKTISIKELYVYGKFFFSSNTLAVRTLKLILKLLLKTFSFSSNGDYFHIFEFLILRTLKNARNNAWTSQPCQIFGCFVFPRRHKQRETTLSSQCMVYC